MKRTFALVAAMLLTVAAGCSHRHGYEAPVDDDRPRDEHGGGGTAAVEAAEARSCYSWGADRAVVTPARHVLAKPPSGDLVVDG